MSDTYIFECDTICENEILPFIKNDEILSKLFKFIQNKFTWSR